MGCSSSSSSQPHPQFYDQYTIGRLLGEGNFGKVYLAESRRPELSIQIAGRMLSTSDKGTVAGPARKQQCVKISRASGNNGTSDREVAQWAESEARVWRQVGQHANCVELIATFVQNRTWYMVMEKCEGCFKQEWSRVRRMLEQDAARVFREMVLGVAHLHRSGIVHRDVKVDNFLLGGPLGATVKLGDFGFATQMPADKLLHGLYGTAPYMSPEMIAGSGYDCTTDVWSLGCTIHVLLCEAYPYEVKKVDAAAMKEAIANDSPKLDLSWTDTSLSHLQHMLERTRANRFSSQQILILPSLSQTQSSPISLTKIRRNRRAGKRAMMEAVLKGLGKRNAEEVDDSTDTRLDQGSSMSSVRHLCTSSTNADSLSSLTTYSLSL